MIYHIISDDIFFLSGANEALRSVIREASIISNNINIRGWKYTRNVISKNPSQKIIVYIHCFRKRRRILRLAASHNLGVIIFTKLNHSSSEINSNSTLISSKCSKDLFLLSSLSSNSNFNYSNRSKKSGNIIKMLSSGISIAEAATKLGISKKVVSTTKNETIKKLGITTAKPHGLLLCRDILEMNRINLRCNNIRKGRHILKNVACEKNNKSFQ